MRRTMEEALVSAFVERAEPELGEITQAQLDDGWQRLQQARSAGARVWPVQAQRRLRLLPLLAAFAVAGLVVGLGVFGYRASSVRPLGYTVEGLAARQGDAIASSSNAVSRLLFSDESHVVLDASTRLTIDGLDARGARIGLLDGAIDVFVKPRANSSWRFSAGPFLVRVKGTSFHLAFTPALGRLQLQMTSGDVEVFAPPGRTVTVSAGESVELFATLPPAASEPVAATPDHQDTSAPPDPRPAHREPRAAVDSPRRRVASRTMGEPASPPVRKASPPASSPDWTQWLRQGRFSQVVADAERRGIDQIIAQGRPADLAALADAARYIKRYPLSRQVLLAMRSRFTTTESAKDAAFFLGRLAEATSGAESALGWYDTYLQEAPRGLYAKAAMGREMRLRAASSRERAGQIARQYLERFPQGPEAELARSLVESHTE